MREFSHAADLLPDRERLGRSSQMQALFAASVAEHVILGLLISDASPRAPPRSPPAPADLGNAQTTAPFRARRLLRRLVLGTIFSAVVRRARLCRYALSLRGHGTSGGREMLFAPGLDRYQADV